MEKEFITNCCGIKVDKVEPRGITKEIEEKVNRKNITELVFILDRSGSMSGIEQDTIGGYNSYLEKQRKNKMNTKITTVLFDDKYELLHYRKDIKDVNNITEEDYYVRGCTALLDAIGKTITNDNPIKINVLNSLPKNINIF